MKVEINNKAITLFVDKHLYSDTVLHKCFYWYSEDFSIDIEIQSEEVYKITLASRGEIADLRVVVEKIKKDLIDFRLRDIVDKETRTIRELLIAKAFSNYPIEEYPTTQISDPVGFDPSGIGK